MTDHFKVYRTHSVTKPRYGVGMLEVHARGTYFTRRYLEALTAEIIGFHIDDALMQSRGPERYSEEFVLQAAEEVRGPWIDIKPIVPFEGSSPVDPYYEDPDDFVDDEYVPWQYNSHES